MSCNLTVLACTVPLPAESQEKIRRVFRTVHYHPDGAVPNIVLPEVDIFFSTPKGLPVSITTLDELPRLRHIQLASAGADKALASTAIGSYAKSGGPISLSTASGVHVLSIPNYVVAMAINLFHQIPQQILIGKTKCHWAEGEEVDHEGQTYFARKTVGRTAGLLGYGALGRETARLLQAHGMHIIAANTSGEPGAQKGYVIPGTGDADGSIPETYYSTRSKDSMAEFFSRCDVLISSLPNTSATVEFLDAEKLGLLRDGAIFINVGRGNVIRSDELVKALDAPDGLFAAAIDVTDPEPLPDNNPLWIHPQLVITPHLSGDTEGEMDLAADILIANADRISHGQEVYNRVHFERGY